MILHRLARMFKLLVLIHVECKICHGSGFSGYGTGYDDVCSNCGGQRATLEYVWIWNKGKDYYGTTSNC